MEYKNYSQQNFRRLPQVARLGRDKAFEMEVVSSVFPFKVNNYVTEELINWDDPDDPIFHLTFPRREMLKPQHYEDVATAIKTEEQDKINATVHGIRMELNPHPAGQIELNVPSLKDGTLLPGLQHKYEQTVLFFPSQGQTCHSYCTFCFRWPQFVKMPGLKFAMQEVNLLIQYLQENPSVSELCITGGDPMVMKSSILRFYINAILDAKISNLKTIRIGTKSLSFWPYRFITDEDAEDILQVFRSIVNCGIHLSIMAHFNHPAELKTKASEIAINRIRETGAEIRSQSPLLKHINDSPAIWKELWAKQVNLGIIPYYMFVVRDTGAQHHFGLPLVRTWEIFRDAMEQSNGLCKTVRGPSMSCTPGKVEILGVSGFAEDKVFVLRFLQGREQSWTYRPFFAKFDSQAKWFDELEPAFGESRFFFDTAIHPKNLLAC